ncbi:MAG: Gfo/Idh/MocA family oxidoreductase [Armatimonadetes bacterium]|nr:Gfo/Idh/MocA family oxidoreductase [Armatimonadota bacterium]
MITRRGFLKGAAAAVALAGRRSSANERIQLGFVGVGSMGSGHLNGFLGNSEVQVVAVCDVYGVNRDKAKKAADDRYGTTDCRGYTDFRALMDDPKIDAVVISTPDHWHTLICIAACEAGKDIYCEKPLTLSIGEGKALVSTVRRFGRVFQVGSQQRSEGNFRQACELVRNGKIGKIHTVRVNLPNGPEGGGSPDEQPPFSLDWNMYLGPAPYVQFNKDRFLWNFRWFWDYSGGQMTDWGAHHFDIAQWGLGVDTSGPVKVEPIKGELPTKGSYETYVNYEAHYEYANGIKMIAGNPERGVRFEGSDGWIHVGRGYINASDPELLKIKREDLKEHLYLSPGHHADWLNCIRSRRQPICRAEIGHRSVSCAHLGNIALRLGRALKWDPIKEEFPGDAEANRMITRPYRAPWILKG